MAKGTRSTTRKKTSHYLKRRCCVDGCKKKVKRNYEGKPYCNFHLREMGVIEQT